MEGRYNDLEILYIKEILDDHGDYIADLLSEAIEEKDLIKQGDLIDSISAKVSNYGIDPVLLLNFISYGRAIEIAWHKHRQNTSIWAKPNTNTMLWGLRENRKRTQRKDTRWYSKIVYGSINRLLSRLATEYSDQEIARLKHILEKQQTR
jgi:hypothetical protein